ncbi:hypothetical protein MASR2M79_00980 [Aminivibrio sp.]
MRSDISLIVDGLHRLNTRPLSVMEVCGTHTVSIFRSGIRSLLPPDLRSGRRVARLRWPGRLLLLRWWVWAVVASCRKKRQAGSRTNRARYDVLAQPSAMRMWRPLREHLTEVFAGFETIAGDGCPG